MTRKTAITTLIIVAIIAVSIVSYLIFSDSGSQKDNGNRVTLTGDDGATFFPIIDTPSTSTTRDSSTSSTHSPSQPISTLRQVTDKPVAGYTTFDRTKTIVVTPTDSTATSTLEREITEVIYRYVERSTGNIYETLSDNSAISRITNTTIPKIYQATFFNDGDGVILRYLDSNSLIETFVANITTQATSTEIAGDESEFSDLQGIFLAKGIPSIVKSSTNDTFFYTLGRDGFVFDANSPANKTQILNSPITSWKLDWNSDDITLITKPSAGVNGIVFNLDPVSGYLEQVFDDKNGLTGKRSADGTKLLYSENKNDEVHLSVYDLNEKKTTNLNFKTLSDKCVWSRESNNIFYCAIPENLNVGNYPDKWYQGKTSFNDKLYKINIISNKIDRLDGLVGNFDIINMQLTEKEDYLLFVNKKDLTLWSLDIK